MFFFFIVIIILVFPGMVVKSEPFSIAAGLDYLTLCLKKILYDIAVLCLYRYILRLFFACWWNIKTYFSIFVQFPVITFLLDSGNYILQFGLIWNVLAGECKLVKWVPVAGDIDKEICEGKKSRTFRSNYQNHKLCLLFCESGRVIRVIHSCSDHCNTV